MIKNISTLSVKIGDREYKFHCDMDSPLGEVHDALTKMKSFAIDKMSESNKPIEQPSSTDECVVLEE